MKKNKIAIIGLGYVGLPLALAFSKHYNVIGFDVDENKIQSYRKGEDLTEEVGNEALKNSNIKFTSNEEELKKSDYYIIAVPTPITSEKAPDFKYVESASEVVGRNMGKGSIAIYESTVYPGATEDICIPILEKESGLKCGKDFKIGYSPERINPGDKEHRLENIVKVVSGMDEESLDKIAKLYETIIEAGVHRAENIKTAEACKIIENAQRDINIAFMNELAIVFNEMNIDIFDVLKAAETKWNFLNFTPGLVGGHCISVDPYYFIHKAKELGYRSQLIISGRKINDEMGNYVAENIIKLLIKNDKNVKNSSVLILGITFKQNCPDIRNTKVIDIIRKLQEYEINIDIEDPLAHEKEVLKEYNIKLSKNTNKNINKKYDAVILAVEHDEFKNITPDYIKNISTKPAILVDIKESLDKKEFIKEGIEYWGL
ncbi:MAG: nucleotide sugar dehydrogenase [Methanobrevibacter sp.]|jgi:UDP-N-acetyl-D-galactosamine dehydrogenase|nr:nucleotide sugar dehydrogenase [Candidatus Methanoflexus mossambicus]